MRRSILKIFASILCSFFLFYFSGSCSCNDNPLTGGGGDEPNLALLVAAYFALNPPDDTPPVPGGTGTITASGETANSVNLSWTAATDNIIPPANLMYLAYYSTSNNISTVAEAETNGTAVGSYAANITSKTVTGLSPTTSYYFNVLVKDPAGNKAAYTAVTTATTLCSTNSALPIDLTMDVPTAAGVSVGSWCFFRVAAVSDGFHEITLTDSDGVTGNNPDLYLSYLGAVPAANTVDANWVPGATTSGNGDHTISNYYLNTASNRIIGIYGTGDAGTPGGKIDFTVDVTRVGDMPVGCTSPYDVFKNLAPYTASVGGSNVAESITVSSGGSTEHYYVLVNDLTTTRTPTQQVTFSAGFTDETGEISIFTANECGSPSQLTSNSCSTTGCSAAIAPNLYAGDFNLIRIQVSDGSGGFAGNYTLTVTP